MAEKERRRGRKTERRGQGGRRTRRRELKDKQSSGDAVLQVQDVPLPSFLSFYSLAHHSPSVARWCPCLRALHQRWGYRSIPPSLPPPWPPATLTSWCRFTATGRPGEPLVSSLPFQNVLLNVLLFLSSLHLSPPPLTYHKLLPFPHRRSLFLIFFFTTWAPTRLFFRYLMQLLR